MLHLCCGILVLNFRIWPRLAKWSKHHTCWALGDDSQSKCLPEELPVWIRGGSNSKTRWRRMFCCAESCVLLGQGELHHFKTSLTRPWQMVSRRVTAYVLLSLTGDGTDSHSLPQNGTSELLYDKHSVHRSESHRKSLQPTCLSILGQDTVSEPKLLLVLFNEWLKLLVLLWRIASPTSVWIGMSGCFEWSWRLEKSHRNPVWLPFRSPK